MRNGSLFAGFALLLLTARPAHRLEAAAGVSVTVDPNADRHPVSPLIYGVNFGSAAQISRLRIPVRRWGGNSVTRYNWENDTHNTASDWFFGNYASDVPDPAALPDGSTVDVFVDEIRNAGGEALVTVPLIGWTPIDRTRRWGFSVARYGAQRQTECTATGNAFWCNPDMGNGVKPSGANVTGNDPADTSKPIGPDFVTRWMAHLAGRTGRATQGGVRLWALDNEPFLWNSTHRDVHPAGVSYDELWAKTVAIASAVKAQDPGAKVLGPADWGWCAYFWSAADGCGPGPDRAAHGGVDFLPWYLQQAKAWETAHGVRLLDYLDIHYYPQASGVALTNDESSATSALRLRTLKSLYDPTYVDESWIGQPVKLIPRMKAWIAAFYPGTKLAISEYNWGSDDGISGALAQAEALAIFGREGVDLATRWVAPADASRGEDAFLLYRNYDGAGAQVAGDSVRATSSDVNAVGAYAQRGGAGGNTLWLLLFNKDTSPRTTTVSVGGGLSGSAALYRFTGASRLAAAGTAAPSAGTLALDLPARSATLVVATLPGTPPSGPLTFHPATPCRVLDTRGAAGPLGGPALAAASRRDFVVTGTCGVPAATKAVSANVTVTGATAGGSIAAFPSDLTQAPGTSTLSFSAGQTRASSAMLLLSRDGTGRIAFESTLASGSVHLVVDVNGWFE